MSFQLPSLQQSLSKALVKRLDLQRSPEKASNGKPSASPPRAGARGGRSSRHWQLEVAWVKRGRANREQWAPDAKRLVTACSSYRQAVPSLEASNLFLGPLAEVHPSPEVHKAQPKAPQFLPLVLSSATCTVLALSSTCSRSSISKPCVAWIIFSMSFESPPLQQNDR